MTPLYLLSGFMCDARLFGPQIAALKGERFVLAHVPMEPTLQEMAKTFLAHAPDRFALGGLSMGGILALEIMTQAPERIERLALMDTTARVDGPKNHAIRTRQIEDVMAGNLDEVMRDELMPAYLSDKTQSPELLDLCLDMARALGTEVFKAQCLALRDRVDYRETLGDINVPTLVLCGDQDRLCPPKLHEELHAGIKGSTFVKVRDAGHLPTLEQSKATTAALATWLRTPH